MCCRLSAIQQQVREYPGFGAAVFPRSADDVAASPVAMAGEQTTTKTIVR